MATLRSICVYCGSSLGGKEVYRQAAEQLGRELVSRGIRLVYGAGSVGLMGVLARTVFDRGGEVLGVIPEPLSPREVAGDAIGDVIVVETRCTSAKRMMTAAADAFIAMPGGFGTLDELFEAITWGQIRHPPQADRPASTWRAISTRCYSGWTWRSRKVSCARSIASCLSSSDEPSLLIERLASPPTAVANLHC
jgi:uncharacterized protein (TIGR00730 family)